MRHLTAPTDRLFTRIERGATGHFLGLICRQVAPGVICGRYVHAFGSRRTVRQALRRAMREARHPS